VLAFVIADKPWRNSLAKEGPRELIQKANMAIIVFNKTNHKVFQTFARDVHSFRIIR
jgi:hypothetical protein